MFGKKLRIAIGVVIIIIAAGIGVLAYAGYFGGPVFTIVPAAAPPPSSDRGTVAIYLSGDAGFNFGTAPHVSHGLAASGVPVVGVNSLTYFRHQRTRAEARDLVVAAANRALALPGARRVVLIAQSFGADVLQYVLPDLPQPLRSRVAMVVLIVPARSAELRANPLGVIGYGPGIPVARSMAAFDWAPALCIQGIEETDSQCALNTNRNIRRIALPGDHYLDHTPDRVTEIILRALASLARGRAR